MRATTDFFDIPPLRGVDYPVYNRREYPAAPEEAIYRLRRHFEPHDSRLAALLNRPLPWLSND